MMEYIVDTDMGFDDFIALCMLIKNGIKIKGMTTSFGNTTVENVTENVLSFINMAGLDIPVYKGSSSPLIGEFIADPTFSGEKGMFGANFPKFLGEECELLSMYAKSEYTFEGHHLAERPRAYPKIFFGRASDSKEAVEFLISESDKNTSIISLGPATNIARALKNKPDLEVGEVITSSGYFGINDVKEKRMAWNMKMDPEATKIIYKSGLKIKCIGLDASGNFADNDFTYFKDKFNKNSEIGRMLEEAGEFIEERSYRYFTLVSDALAVMPVINENSTEFVKGEVSFTDSLDESFCRLVESQKSRVEVAKKVDLDLFIKELLKII